MPMGLDMRVGLNMGIGMGMGMQGFLALSTVTSTRCCTTLRPQTVKDGLGQVPFAGRLGWARKARPCPQCPAQRPCRSCGMYHIPCPMAMAHGP